MGTFKVNECENGDYYILIFLNILRFTIQLTVLYMIVKTIKLVILLLQKMEKSR